MMESHRGESAISNSDSYHYFATDFYWTKNCQGRPKVDTWHDFTDDESVESVRTGMDDAILILNVLLDGFRNEKELFMGVYDEYFLRSDSNRDDPDNNVMGWSSL